MYGLVNQGLQDFVVSVGGESAWRSVLQSAGVDASVFVSMQTYPDSMSYSLVGAASRVLGMSAHEVLRSFGKYWILYTARRGYGAIFDTMGRTLPEFLANLDVMHTRLSLSMPQLRPPSFVCGFRGDVMCVQYRSEREGLAPMVIGLLEGLGEMYGLDIVVRHQPRDDEADVDEFLVEALNGWQASDRMTDVGARS